MKEQLTNQLKQIAIYITTPFCYGCYVEAPKGRCIKCGSDDLMLLLPGVGCEYGLC
jgi:rRNA maturation endonuclease Nob1